MKKILFTFLVLTCISSDAIGQIKNNQFIISGRFNSRISGTYFHLPMEMSGPNGDIEIDKRRSDKSLWTSFSKFGDFNAGLKIILIRPRSHVGGFMYLDYKNKGFEMKYPGETEFKTHAVETIAPALGLRFNTGDFTKSFAWLFEVGAAYNHNFKYSGSYNDDKKVVNNGITGIYGFGFEFRPGGRDNRSEYTTKDSYFSMTIQYHKDHYDFFNNNFSPNGISTPYKGFTNNFGYVALNMIIRGTMQFTDN